jgi:pantetheine-phosphate adenylyltransferase
MGVMTTGIYAGSFDPFTHGHLSVLNGALAVFEKVHVAIGVNSGKAPTFTPARRHDFIQSYLKDHPDKGRVTVVNFEGLLVSYCASLAISGTKVAIVRGLRAVSDFEAEMAIADANARLVPEIPTVFIPTPADRAFISSSVVKELASHGASFEVLTKHYVTSEVAHILRYHFGKE